MHTKLPLWLFGVSTLSLAACAGRTAAWQEEPTPVSGSAATTASSPTSAAPGSGDEAWAQRSDRAKVEAAIAAWEQDAGCTPGTSTPKTRCAAISTAADDVELYTKVTHAYYFLADGFLRADEAAYLEMMDRGVWWGERALVAASPEFDKKMREKAKFHEAIKVVGPEGVGAMYWYSASLGKWAKRTSFAVLVGQKDNIRATMERVLELDPEYFHGAPDRYFGAFYAIAPGFAGGDLAKSREHFDKSLARAPYYLGTKVLMAENLYTKEENEAAFVKVLQEVIDAPDSAVPPELLPEAKIEREKAKELLADKDELF